jgi:hypothetical protein
MDSPAAAPPPRDAFGWTAARFAPHVGRGFALSPLGIAAMPRVEPGVFCLPRSRHL